MVRRTAEQAATHAGVIRDRQNWIGGEASSPANADSIPPPHTEVDGLLTDLAAFCERSALSPVLQAAIAHAQFETIHPFWDGNGRVGRALIHVVLRRRGLVERFLYAVSLVLAPNTDAYVKGLTLCRRTRSSICARRSRSPARPSRRCCGRSSGSSALASSARPASAGATALSSASACSS
jgi:Fic family protein